MVLWQSINFSKGKLVCSIHTICIVVGLVSFSFQNCRAEMSNEFLQGLQAIRGGNRGVVTKLVNEAGDILNATIPLEPAQRNVINVE